jgi:hypothetical protein
MSATGRPVSKRVKKPTGLQEPVGTVQVPFQPNVSLIQESLARSDARDKQAARDLQLREACAVVERYARLIGRECEIVFCDDDVQVALLSWGGAVNASTLYEALTQARKESDESD